jgi:hypothetical protein
MSQSLAASLGADNAKAVTELVSFQRVPRLYRALCF